MIPFDHDIRLWDIALGADGDLLIGPDDDLAISVDEDCLLDNIHWRLRTALGDWVLEPKCGASLERFVGMPNSREVGTAIREAVDYALSHDGYLSLNDYRVDVVPLSPDTVGVYIFVRSEFGTFDVLFRLNLRTGEFEEIRLS